MLVSTLARLEHIANIPLATLNSSYNLPTQGGLIPNDRFMWGLRLMYEGRMTNPASAGPTGVEADGALALIEQITVEGFHRIRGSREQFINVRGPDLRELVRLYTLHAPLLTPATLSVTASATNDVRFIIDVPFVPLQLPWRAQLNWLLDAPNYEQLQLTVRYSDSLSVFVGGTTAPTFTAYGSASGNPRLVVHGLFAQAGPTRFAGYVPGRVFRYHSEVTSGDIVSGSTASRLFNFPKGYYIRSILLKTGTKSTGVTSGNNSYATLSDDILTNLKVYRGLNKLNRFSQSMYELKEDFPGIGGPGVITPSTGYALMDWAPRGFDAEVLDTRALVAGPSGDVDLFLESAIAAGAAQAALALYEEWRFAAATLIPASARRR